MIAKLQALLTLQELDSRLDELDRPATTDDEAGAAVLAKEAKRLRARRRKLVREVGSELFDRYEQLRRRHRRAIVQVRHDVCLGCNTVRPTSSKTRAGRVDTCERCGRILFPVQEAVAVAVPQTRRTRAGVQKTRGKRSSA